MFEMLVTTSRTPGQVVEEEKTACETWETHKDSRASSEGYWSCL